MVLHGTGGTGQQFLRPQFADELYGPGQPLDIRRYWIILPDNIGHGKSSKPSDGLRMRFPKYDYADMVAAQHAMLQQLGVTPAAADHGHVDGLHACVHVGRDLSDLRQGADAARLRADRDRRAQPHVAAAGDRRHREGSGLATAAITRHSRSRACARPNRSCSSPAARRSTSRRNIRRASRPRAFVEESVARGLKGLDANDTDLSVRFVAELRSVAQARDDHRADDVDQFRRRLHQSAQPSGAAARGEADEERAIPADSRKRRNARARDAHLGEFWKDDLSALLARSR